MGDSGDDDEEEKDDEDEKEDKEEKKDKKDEESTWAKFYKEFNKNLKMGCYEDDSNRSKISKLLRFKTTKSEDKDVSWTSIWIAWQRAKKAFTTCLVSPWRRCSKHLP